MGVNEFFYGGYMRLGNCSRAKRLVTYLFIFCYISLFSLESYSNPLGALALRTILGRVIAQRASQVALSEASAGLLARQTALSVSRNIALGTLPKSPGLISKGAITWAGIGYGLSALTQEDLTRRWQNGEINLHTDGIDLGNGTYQVRLPNGSIRIVDFKPTKTSPVMTYSELTSTTATNNTSSNGVMKSYSVPESALYSAENHFYSNGNVDNVIYSGNKTKEIAKALLEEQFPLQDKYKTVERTVRYTELSGEKEVSKNFSYVEKRFEFDFQHLASKKEGELISKEMFGAIKPNIVGNYSFVNELFRVNIKEIRVRDDFEPCQYFTVSKVVEGKLEERTIQRCSVPKQSDYVTKMKKVNEEIMVSLNFDYTPNNVTSEIPSLSGNLDDFKNQVGNNLNTLDVSLDLLARLFNQILSRAVSNPSYQGVPFSSTTPITADDVRKAMKSANISNVSLSDLFSPATTGNNQLDIDISFLQVNNHTDIHNNQPNTQLEDEDNVDIEDAELTMPEIEPPTARQILEPFNKFFPTLKNINVNHSAQCPKWTFDIPFLKFNYEMKEHCSLIEEQRSLIELIFSVVWAFVALRLLLSA